MHARRHYPRLQESRAFRCGLRVLAAALAAMVYAEHACAQSVAEATSPGAQSSPLSGVPSSPPSNNGGSLDAEAIINAAAEAASRLTGRQLDPNALPPPSDAPGAASNHQRRPNPFKSGVPAPASNGIFIPAHRADPEKIAVQETDGLISLMVREGSLRQVVAMIAETQKLNIVFAGPADSQVTASFDRQPWEAVLDALLSASGHTWAVRDGIIFVSSIENADFLPPGAEGRQVQIFELDFTSATDIDQTVKGLLSPAGSSWIVESQNTNNRRTRDAVAVCDYPSFLARIGEYICQADQPPRQVYIETHILQVKLDESNRSGVNFQELISAASGRARLTAAGMASQPATPTLPNPFPPTGPTATSPSFFVEIDGTGLDAVIELVKSTNDVKTLASPKIHAVDGQESRINIGEQIGYRVTTTTQTSTSENVEFLETGVILRVTPHIARDGRILMRIHPEVSTGQLNPLANTPDKKSTEVDTDVLVSSGQGIVIGGLIQETDNMVVNKVPLLGEIPYLGLLFQRRQAERSRQEIIVTLQPHVLPYEPIVQARLDQEFVRSTQPLTQGALGSHPRPYEPRMPDVLGAHGAPLLPQRWNPPVLEGELMALPPIETMLEEMETGAVLEYGAEESLTLETLPTPEPDDSVP